MGLKLLTAFVGLLILLVIIPNAVSQGGFPNFYKPPRLYFVVNKTDGKPSLIFTDYKYYDDHKNYQMDEFDLGASIEINGNENVILSTHNITNRVYNRDTNIHISIVGLYSDNVYVRVQLRCDGDGDGIFEYIIDFPETSPSISTVIEPSGITGNAIDLTDGTIELHISRTDNSSADFQIWHNVRSYVQVPFDLDFDGDGIGDYSDPDDDNDGYSDWGDRFPYNPNEWKDYDDDGIGDNEDEDDNGNGIPDDFEIPLAMGIILIPIVIIAVFVKRMKKSKSKVSGEEEIKPITISKLGPKNW